VNPPSPRALALAQAAVAQPALAAAEPVDHEAPRPLLASLDPMLPQLALEPFAIAESTRPLLPQDTRTGMTLEEYNAAFAQQEAEPRETRWAVAGHASPVYSFRQAEQLQKPPYSTVLNPSMDYYEAIDSPILTYTAGLNLGFQPLARLSVRAGLYYSQFGHASNEFIAMNSKSGAMVNTSAGAVRSRENFLPDSPNGSGSVSNALTYSDQALILNFEYLEMPMTLKYALVDRRFDFSLLGGLSANFLVGNKAYVGSVSAQTEIGQTQSMRPTTYVGNVGVGFDYDFDKRLSLSIEPTFRYALNSASLGDQMDYRPYSFGLFSGFAWRF